jgi:serine/threonine-protein kinase
MALPGFTLEGIVGSGPSTLLQRARRDSSGREVVIKALKEGVSAKVVAANFLRREGAILARLAHPNIVLLIDQLEHEGRPYLILESLDGETLREVERRTLRLAPARVARVGLELLRALVVLHEAGFAHRDIKPDNIVLTKAGPAKLIDFGLAARLEVDPRSDGVDAAGFGSPAYMAPEQLLGELPSAVGDLFSLGVVLYEATSGKKPFDRGVDRKATGDRARIGEATSLRSLVPGIEGEFADFVMTLVRRRAEERPASAKVAEEELERIVRALGWNAANGAGAEAGREVLTGHVTDQATRRALLSFGAMGLVFSLATAGVYTISRRAGSPPGSTALELAPRDAALLKVMADPWAEVWVDGQKVETTPFARAIPLAPSTHYVMLKHPQAPTELREISPKPGELITLDVVMQVDADDAGVTRAGGFWNPNPPAVDAGVETDVVRRKRRWSYP